MTTAILWTIAYAITLISALLGGKPNWLQVFIPLTILTLDYWVKALP